MIVDTGFRPHDEAGRLAALRRYDILDTPPEQEFEDIVALVKSVFHMPFAAINLIDSSRQWSKAMAGIDISECKRSDAFCDHTIRSLEPLAVGDASRDPRFALNPFVTPEDGIRSYLGVPLTSPDGYNIGALCVFGTEPRDFSAAEVDVLRNLARVVMSQLELRIIARQDSLTGALTRRGFLSRLAAVVDGGVQSSACLLLFDLDHFKTINDRFGHPTGDIVLKEIAGVVRRTLRRSDSFGRLGGEEFGVLLIGTGNALAASVAEGFAERLRTAIGELDIPAIAGERVTISLGATFWHPPETVDEWLARADTLLYTAKNQGRNRSVSA